MKELWAVDITSSGKRPSKYETRCTQVECDPLTRQELVDYIAHMMKKTGRLEYHIRRLSNDY